MFYIVIAVLALYVVSESFNRAERTKLLNRIMSRDYPQFKYYENKWPKDIREVEKLRDEAHVDRQDTKKEDEAEDDADSLY